MTGPVAPPAPVASVVIPAFNAGDTIGEQLDALVAQHTSERFEVLVADNGSTDETRNVVLRYADADRIVRLLDASDRRGPAHARNAGAAAAIGQLLLFCDADDVVHPRWVEAMVDAWRGGAMVLGGKLEAVGPPDVVVWRGDLQSEALPSDFLPYVVSANLGCDATLFRQLRGFDESFPTAAGEDSDFCFRAHYLGVEPSFVPEAVISYRHRTELRDALKQSFGYGKASAQLYRRWAAYGFIRYGGREHARRLVRYSRRVRSVARDPRARGPWAWNMSYFAGRIAGALEQRVLFW